jgi:ribosomal protein L17
MSMTAHTFHVREAELYLSLAARLRVNNRFEDPQTAELLLGLSQTHATLAHLPEQQVIAQERLAKVLRVVVDRVIAMATSYEGAAQRHAHEFIRDLDEAGVNIDDLIDERSAETGHGPRVLDVFGQRYDLTKQWSDRHGKQWEHTGSWSDVGGPVMSRDEPDGESMVLVDLIRDRGPLHLVVPAPQSPVVREPELPPF